MCEVEGLGCIWKRQHPLRGPCGSIQQVHICQPRPTLRHRHTTDRFTIPAHTSFSTPLAETYQTGQAPSIKEAQAIADEIFADFVSMEVDKVEMVYTKFISLITSGQ
jgi:hypothetical protein